MFLTGLIVNLTIGNLFVGIFAGETILENN